MTSRIYVGRVNYRVTERDLEHFFRGYGKVRDIVVKPGFAFVEFEDYRDAEDAVHDLNGKELMGDRVVLEFTRRGPRPGWRFEGPGGYRSAPGSRFGPPRETRYRVVVENLTTRFTWMELKDMFRDANCEVTFADAHRERRNEGVVCFASRRDLERGIDKCDGRELNGRKIKIVDDTPRSRSRSRDRSRSRSKDRSRSRGRRASRSRSRDRRTRSRSRTRSPAKNGAGGDARSPSGKRDRGDSRDKSRSKSPRDKSRSKSRSRSRSRSVDKKEPAEPTDKQRSRSRSGDRRSRSASRSPTGKGGSAAGDGKREPDEERRSKSKSASRSASRSPPPKRARSRSGSGSPARVPNGQKAGIDSD